MLGRGMSNRDSGVVKRLTETGSVVRPDVTGLAIYSDNQVNSGHFIPSELGMRFPRQLSYERWKTIGHQLASVGKWSAWCLGDWLVHGEEHYNGRYRDAVDQSGLDYQTLRNYAWVARRFNLSRRRDTLSLAHHAEVASLPEHEQDFWLRKAEEARWSRNRLRKEVRASLAERSGSDSSDGASPALPAASVGTSPNGIDEVGSCTEAEGSAKSSADSPLPASWTGPTSGKIQVSLSGEQMKSCKAAAERFGRSLEEWASSTLDHAARHSLETSGEPRTD